MAKKLAPLVIPTVLDTSGISRGVSSIRNRLRGVGGAGGTATGAGGFSSGVIPYGLGGSGGDGGAGAAMAAAFGATAGSRMNRWKDLQTRLREQIKVRNANQAGPLRTISVTGRKGTESRQLYNAQAIEARSIGEFVTAAMKSYAHPTEANILDTLFFRNNKREAEAYKRKQELIDKVTGRAYFQRKASQFSALRQRMAGAEGGLLTGMGGLLGLGSAAGIIAAARQFSPNAMFDRFQDVSNLRGSQREMAYAMKRRLFQAGKQATLGQRFFMGTQGMMGPDQPSATERTANMISAGMGKVAERAGVVFEHLIFAATDPQRYGMWWAAYLDSDKRGN